MQIYEIPCAVCGEITQAQHGNKLYCSDSCRQRARYKQVSYIAEARNCLECQETFTPKRPASVFCSKACYMKGYYLRNKDKYAARERKRGHHYNWRHRCDWDDMFASFWSLQDGKCYLCGNPLDRAEYRGINLDHDHSCCPLGRSCEKCRRGLVHRHCNSVLGYAEDDPDRLRRIADNLEAAKALVRERLKGHTQ